MHATCHCTAIILTTPTPTAGKDRLLECQCSVCSRYGAIWAYFPLSAVTITKSENVSTRAYTWGKKNIEFHACERCNGLVYWWPVDEGRIKQMAVNSRMVVERSELEGVEVVQGGPK